MNYKFAVGFPLSSIARVQHGVICLLKCRVLKIGTPVLSVKIQKGQKKKNFNRAHEDGFKMGYTKPIKQTAQF